MKKYGIGLAVTVLALGLTVGAAFAKGQKAGAGAAVCVLLPDTKSSVRWETQDRPTFIAAFKKANVTATVVNFPANTTITLTFGTKRLSSIRTGADGSGSVTFLVPQLKGGTHSVVATKSSVTDSAKVWVW